MAPSGQPETPEPLVPPIIASRLNIYAGSPLQRVAERREDAAWIAQASHAPDSLLVPVWRAKSLVAGMEEAAPRAVYLPGGLAALPPEASIDAVPWCFLGLLDDRAVFTADLSHLDDPVPVLPADTGGFTDLRAVGGAALGQDAAVLAHARALMHWRTRTRFCAVCGAPCEPRSAGHVMLCTRCATQHFPRTDPAVIMLIHREGRVLLGHSQRFPRATMYSTLAGFVEPGETLEEAVRREVAEEAGITVGRVDYHSSQPWPFPGNVMLGYYGEALSEAITIDPTELLDARWFTLAELRAPEAHGFSLPRPDSIARRLIEDWMAAQ